MARTTFIIALLSLFALAACNTEKANNQSSAQTNATATSGTSQTPTSPAAKPAEPTDLPAPPDVAAPPADAQKTASGLASKVLKPGTGKDHPAATTPRPGIG
jgi:hypothetical protein